VFDLCRFVDEYEVLNYCCSLGLVWFCYEGWYILYLFNWK